MVPGTCIGLLHFFSLFTSVFVLCCCVLVVSLDAILH